MGKIVTIAQQKGGAGKTSLAIHLAVAWAGRGRSVCLIDSDPQGSASAWHAIRQQHDGPAKLDFRSIEGWKVPGEVAKARRLADIVVIDTPPHAETAARTAVREADLVLIPMQPSPLDLWATGAGLDMASAEGRPVQIVFNRVPPRGRVAEAVMADVARLGAGIAKTTVGNRQAFAASLTKGLGITEHAPRTIAAQEAAALAREVTRKLAKL